MIVPDVIVEVHFAKLQQNHTVFNISLSLSHTHANERREARK